VLQDGSDRSYRNATVCCEVVIILLAAVGDRRGFKFLNCASDLLRFDSKRNLIKNEILLI
jgi:hypothetical protein